MRRKNPEGNPVGKPIGTERARELSTMRRTFGAGSGRPRSDSPRCACGLMTLRLALLRCHNCEEPEPRSHKRKEGL